MSIESRLREERERLGVSQEQFGVIGGVKKLAQFNYEKGERAPDALYLAAIAAAGADVLYILTGERDGPAPLALSGEERLLLDYYRDAPPAVRKAAMAALLSSGTGSAAQVFHGTVTGGVAGRDIVKGGGKR